MFIQLLRLVSIPRRFTNNNSNWHLHNNVMFYYIVYSYSCTKLWLLTIVLILSDCGFRIQCAYLPIIILFSAHEYKGFRIILLHFLNKVGGHSLLNVIMMVYIGTAITTETFTPTQYSFNSLFFRIITYLWKVYWKQKHECHQKLTIVRYCLYVFNNITIYYNINFRKTIKSLLS